MKYLVKVILTVEVDAESADDAHDKAIIKSFCLNSSRLAEYIRDIGTGEITEIREGEEHENNAE